VTTLDSPLLEGIPIGDRRRLLAACRRRRFAKGEVIFHAGDPGDSLHLVASGHVGIWSSTDLGDSMMLNVLGPGGFFGELSLLDRDDHRSATVRALETTETLSLGREAFDVLRSQYPSVDQVLLTALAIELRRTSELLMEVLSVPAEIRVLRRLHQVALSWAAAQQGLVLPLTQDHLAALAGTTRSTANRALRQAEAEGLLTLGRGRIELVNPEGLASRARSR